MKKGDTQKQPTFANSNLVSRTDFNHVAINFNNIYMNQPGILHVMDTCTLDKLYMTQLLGRHIEVRDCGY